MTCRIVRTITNYNCQMKLKYNTVLYIQYFVDLIVHYLLAQIFFSQIHEYNWQSE